MALHLPPEEPEAGPWRAELLSSGKTTLAARIGQAVPGSAVIHTDDIAWAHSRFGWADLLIDGLLIPARRGQAVSFRPPRWVEHGRDGSLRVPVGSPLLIIEGAGAGRREAAPLTDALIWVQSDEHEAERRSLARIGQPGGPATEGHLRAWMAEEIPFNADQRTWERADLVACGTPYIRCDPRTEIVVAPAPAPAS
jgi:hypothetical protein